MKLRNPKNSSPLVYKKCVFLRDHSQTKTVSIKNKEKDLGSLIVHIASISAREMDGERVYIYYYQFADSEADMIHVDVETSTSPGLLLGSN
jgi:hypothetical protein